MKKISVMIFLAALTVAAGGCSLKKTDKAPDEPVSVTEAETTIATEAVTSTSASETTTAPAVPDDKLEPASGKYLYDLAHLIDDNSEKEINSYLEKLYRQYMLNAAVVTVSDLHDKAVYTYAAEAYFEIYGGEGNGLLFLINNDTFEDHLYKTGSCTHMITDTDEKSLLFTATENIVGGDYISAIQSIMNLGEKCPSHVFDNASVFSADDIKAIETALSANTQTNIAIVAEDSIPAGKDQKKYAEELFKRHFADGKGVLFLIDTTKKTIIYHSDSALSPELDAALKKAASLAAKGDIAGASKTLSQPVSTEKTENETETKTAQ